MQILIQNDSAVPVFQQLMDGVKGAIARGAVRPGEMIPSVRQMAAAVLINPNTVAKAYRELEREGVLYTRRGLGVFVSEQSAAQCVDDQRTQLRSSLTEAVRQAREAGLDDREVRDTLERILDDRG